MSQDGEEAKDTLVFSSNSDDVVESAGSLMAAGRVQQIASALYNELDILSNAHGSQAIERLIPLIIRALESLEDAARDADLCHKENDQIKEDQLEFIGQLERERTARKSAET
ncbi:SIX homeobox, partial [Cichlidogyrus casuarinus]